MSTWVGALVAAAAIGLTSVFCVRPMMRGHSGCTMHRSAAGQLGDRSVREREIAQLREELRVLRAQGVLDRQTAPPAKG
jgi:PII-like signaling protein